MGTQVVTEQTPGLEIELIPESEHESPEGQFASGDDALDAADVAAINDRLLNGDCWAWFTARVCVTYLGYEVNEYLGCCSYADEKDFRDGGYYADMVYEALKQLNAQLEAIDACELAPHKSPILACACGYTRRNGNGR